MKRFLFFLLACLFLHSPLAHATKAYKNQLKLSSRSNEFFNVQEMNTVIKWAATRLDEVMIEAQIEEYSKIYNLIPADKEAYRAARYAEKGNSQLFFVSFYTDQKDRFSDLSLEKSQWRLVLIIDGREYLPTRYLKVNKPGPLELHFYPYFIPWATGYYVWFDAPPTLPMNLTLRGPRGSSVLEWK